MWEEIDIEKNLLGKQEPELDDLENQPTDVMKGAYGMLWRERQGRGWMDNLLLQRLGV